MVTGAGGGDAVRRGEFERFTEEQREVNRQLVDAQQRSEQTQERIFNGVCCYLDRRFSALCRWAGNRLNRQTFQWYPR
jgi:hypothetical protein